MSKLIKKGAEADLWLDKWYGKLIVKKHRIAKKYRLADFDKSIRVFRTIHEAELLHDAKCAGVPTPTIYAIDLLNTTIIMEYVEGIVVKRVIEDMPKRERQKLFEKIGKLIGKLHKMGIIHGDLTTSNMILTEDGRIYFIDFGLGAKSESLEERGVDLHLMERALESTHYNIARESFRAVMRGYEKVMGTKEAKEVRKRIVEIRKRARYVKR